MLDLIVDNAYIVEPDNTIFMGGVAVKDGKIELIFHNRNELEATKVIDAQRQYLLPGLIDPHVHYGYHDEELDFETETRAAAIGGMTTTIRFFRHMKPYDNLLPLDIGRASRRAIVDISFHIGLLIDDHIDKIPQFVMDFGIRSFKFYMPFRGEEGRLLGFEGIDDGFMFDAFHRLAEMKDTVAVVHAENPEIIARLKKKIQVKRSSSSLAAWTEARPGWSEAEAISRAAMIARAAGVNLYIAHLGCKEGLDIVRQYRTQGQYIYIETCPHYLTHTKDSEIGSIGKVIPPLRDEADNNAFWDALIDGEIDTVGSDHVTFFSHQKPLDDIWNARPGFPGTSTILPVLLSEGYHKRNLSLGRIVQACSLSPARIFGLSNKGRILPGKDADFTIVNLEIEKKVTPSLLGGASDISIYDGWTLKGWPTMTILRGKVIMENGEVVGSPGYGKFIKR